MSKHTTGPWKTGDGYSAHKTTVFTGRSVLIARAESEDDARLISSAPDLLAALQAFMDDANTREVRAMARSAIAKATGG